MRDAEAVSKRHRAELMKIPHVTYVTGEVDGQNEAAILVEVDDQKNVDAVTRQVPSQIEGFPVEVMTRISDDDDSVGRNRSLGRRAPTPTPPTIDKNGYYHHAWLKPSAPATNPARRREPNLTAIPGTPYSLVSESGEAAANAENPVQTIDSALV